MGQLAAWYHSSRRLGGNRPAASSSCAPAGTPPRPRSVTLPGTTRRVDRFWFVGSIVGACGFVLATVMLVPEHLLGVEVLPDTWDAFLDLGLLFVIGGLLIRRPAATGGRSAPVFTKGLLLGLVAASFVGASAALVALWHEAGPPFAVSAVALLTFSVLPLRAFVRSRADTVLFGSSDEPYVMLTSLGHCVETAGTPDAALREVVHAVATTLGLPYVAIELDADSTPADDPALPAPEFGTRRSSVTRFALVHQGRHQGWLVVSAPRGSRLAPADRRLLADLSAQIGAAAHTVHLVQQLRRANRRMIAARADERQRLRRDLHDGMGPMLAGIGLEAQAARNLLHRDPSASADLIDQVVAESHAATTEVRRLVENLRPLALERLGLIKALRHKLVASPARATTSVTTVIDAGSEVGDLPADVELAAFRIVLEAHTNVLRHSGATFCRIEITRDDDLTVRIVDNGHGPRHDGRTGVGRVSMAERAAELGGTCVVGAGARGGTEVVATLPVVP